MQWVINIVKGSIDGCMELDLGKWNFWKTGIFLKKRLREKGICVTEFCENEIYYTIELKSFRIMNFFNYFTTLHPCSTSHNHLFFTNKIAGPHLFLRGWLLTMGGFLIHILSPTWGLSGWKNIRGGITQPPTHFHTTTNRRVVRLSRPRL